MQLTLRNLCLALTALTLGVMNLVLIKGRTPTTEQQRLFPELQVDVAARITIQPVEGEEVNLFLNQAGVWSVQQRFGWRAYQPAVEALLRGLAGATDGEREATSRTSHAALGVDELQGIRIRVENRDGRVVADLIQGIPPEGTRGSRLLPAGQDSVYRTPTVPRVVPDPSRLIDGDILPFDANNLSAFSVRLELPDGSLRDSVNLIRQEDGRFAQRLSRRYLTPAMVDPLLKALESLVVRDVVPAPEGIDADSKGPPFAVLQVDFETIDGGRFEGQAGILRLGFEEPFGLEPSTADSVLAQLSGLGLEQGEVRWFHLPKTSAQRLIALAQRILVAAGD